MDLKVAALSEKNLHRFLREVTMPGADVHNEWVRRLRQSRQGLSEALVHRLADEMFDHSSRGLAL